MRSLGHFKTWVPLDAEPTPSESYVLREFGEAVAFAGSEWQRFDGSHRQADLAWAETFTLKQRVLAFLAGPILPALRARFPKIEATGAEADELTETTGNARVICTLIVGEAIIAAGDAPRSNVRTALPD